MSNTQNDLQTTIGTDGLKNLRFDSTRSDDSCRFAVENNIRKVTLYSSEYKAKDLTPLLPLKDFIEAIFIQTIIDLSLIHEFKNLKELSLDKTSQKIRLNEFGHLTTLCCVLTPQIENLHHSEKLTVLHLSNFNPESGDLTSLPKLPSLNNLGLFKTQIGSLNGITQFPSLGKLNIYSAPKLTDISGLDTLDSLEEVEMETCKSLSDYFPLSRLNRLRKLILTKCGEINSLSFLASLSSLKLFSFVNTNVRDGDLSYCKGIDFVGFLDKRHYNLKSKDFSKPI